MQKNHWSYTENSSLNLEGFLWTDWTDFSEDLCEGLVVNIYKEQAWLFLHRGSLSAGISPTLNLVSRICLMCLDHLFSWVYLSFGHSYLNKRSLSEPRTSWIIECRSFSEGPAETEDGEIRRRRKLREREIRGRVSDITMGCNMCVVKRPEEQYRIMFQVGNRSKLCFLDLVLKGNIT